MPQKRRTTRCIISIVLPPRLYAEKIDVLEKPINIFLGWSNSKKWGQTMKERRLRGKKEPKQKLEYIWDKLYLWLLIVMVVWWSVRECESVCLMLDVSVSEWVSALGLDGGAHARKVYCVSDRHLLEYFTPFFLFAWFYRWLFFCGIILFFFFVEIGHDA